MPYKITAKLLFLIALMFDCSTAISESSDDFFSSFDGSPVDSMPSANIWVDPDADVDPTLMIPKLQAQYIDLNMAIIKVVDISLGKSQQIRVAVDEELNIGKSVIKVSRCVKVNEPGFSLKYKAFMSIINEVDGNTIFNGWLISDTKSFAQPVHGNSFFILNRCISQ